MPARTAAASSDVGWFEHLSRTKTPSFRLFCFPYAGGSADVYRSWQPCFPEQIDLCLVHLPGRGRRMGEPVFTQLGALVKTIAERMRAETNLRYALYGHSMGALISFELCRELFRQHAAGPEHLFVSGRRAPQYPRDEPATFNLSHDGFIARLKKLNGTPREVLENPELMEMFIGVLRADFEIVETYEYRPGEPLPCPITVYGGIKDEDVPIESCRAWQQQTSAGCKVRIFQGDHFFLRNPGLEFITAFRNDVLSTVAASHAFRSAR